MGKRGRTDAGPNRTTAYKAGVGSIDESGKLVGKSHQEIHGGNDNTPTTVTPTSDGKPEKYKSKVKVIGPVTGALWLADTIIGPYTSAYNKKKRSEFARKEGLYRSYYIGNQFNKNPKLRTLDVMSDAGKDFLKTAGYGPFQDKTPTGDGDGDGQRCPDGTMPPCPPQATSTPAATPAPASTTPKSTWQLYPENSDYLTGKGYDTGGGVRKGPPPKRGPNPQVPPVLFSRGGGCAIRGTKFKGVK
jgi:hypothetical protein